MSSKKIKVLIVEDDPFLLKMYAEKFEFENFAVYMAEDGKKGIRIATKEKPDIILLDIILPEISGFDVLHELKSKNETKNIPVILLTNLSQRDDINKGLALGANDYLIKAHFMPSEVVDKVKALLKS
jgi:DNA-binding response OmpR family regulator